MRYCLGRLIHFPEQAWFEQRFGAVFMLTVCLNNGELLLLLKRKRELEQEMLFEAAFDATKYEEYRALVCAPNLFCRHEKKTSIQTLK